MNSGRTTSLRMAPRSSASTWMPGLGQLFKGHRQPSFYP
jgi:hypothetical protein